MADNKKIVFLVDDDLTNLTVGKKALSDSFRVFTMDYHTGFLVQRYCFKKNAVKDYLSVKGTLNDLCTKYDISYHNVLQTLEYYLWLEVIIDKVCGKK